MAHPRSTAVSLDDAEGLRELIEPCAAVIACAGPFAVHGEPVLRAAAEAGTHYLDTTGEQGFMKRVFDEFGPIAEKSGAALMTGMGFDYVPGDMIASLTAEGMGPLEEISLNYAVAGFGPSRGTARTALGQIAGEDVQWLAGRVRAGRPLDLPRQVRLRRRHRRPAHDALPGGRARHRAAPRRDPNGPHRAHGVDDEPGRGRRPRPDDRLQRRAQDAALSRAFEAAVNRLPEGPAEDQAAAPRASRSSATRGPVRGGGAA